MTKAKQWDDLRKANRQHRQRDDSDVMSCDSCLHQFDCSEVQELDSGNYCEQCITNGEEG